MIGILPDMQEFMNDKLGITYDVVKTNENSDFGTVFRPLNDTESKKIMFEIKESLPYVHLPCGRRQEYDNRPG